MLATFACIRYRLLDDSTTSRYMDKSKQDNEDKCYSMVAFSLLNKINKIQLIVVLNETEILFLFSVICSNCFEYFECEFNIYIYIVQLCNTGDSKSLCVCVKIFQFYVSKPYALNEHQ